MPAGNGVKISWFGWAAAAIVPALISFLLVPVMYAAIMLGLTGAIFQSTTHYSCGPATALFAPGYVKQTDWWKMCFILGLFYLLVYGVVGGLWIKLLGLW